MTDYTEGFIHWDLIPGPGLAGQGILTYKGKQYGITITGFEIGFQFTLASYIKFKSLNHNECNDITLLRYAV
ncbi:hypothetical protein [Brucella tritici]|uniref:hypothetical protein n=1 Tax=Brucella tritici TaxID=94626 RepID=UPI002001BDC0|nr:hypothetical protein [Brucella tritici]